MISINKYGQNIDLSKVVEVNGKKSFSLDGLNLNETLIISVTKGMKFKTSLVENDLNVEFTDTDGSVFELILKDMATLLAQNDGEKLVDIVQADDNKILSSITDITSALAAAAAGPDAPAAGNANNSDSAANNDGFANGLGFNANNYANAELSNEIAARDALVTDDVRRNFAPTIETIGAQNVDEDNTLLINYNAADANNDALITTVTATNGTAVITQAGQILFTPNANFNGIAEIVLTISDGTLTTAQTIIVTVNPINDAPVLDAITAVTVLEDAALFSGTITSTDVDANATATYTTTSTVAGFILNADGTYTFDAANIAYQSLSAGDTQTIVIPVTVTDDVNAIDTQNLTITITGTNDAPTVSVTPQALNENDFTVLAGYENAYKLITELEMFNIMGVEDVDLNDNLTLSLVTDSSNFTSTTNAGIVNSNSGVVQLTAADILGYGLTGVANVGDFFIYSIGFDGLNAADVANVTFDVIVSDGTSPVTSTVSVNVDGVNDAPTVNVTTVSLNENDFSTLNGYENTYKIITELEMFNIMGVEDVDLNDNLTLSLVTDSSNFTSTTNAGIVNSNSGVVQLTAADILGYGLTGVANVGDFFIYSIGFDGLNAADVANVTFDVIVSDGTSPVTSTVSVNVDGVNDAPTVNVTTVSLNENDFSTLNGYENTYKIITELEMFNIMGVEDVDLNDSLTLSLVTDSSNFTSTTNAGIVNSNSGVVQLTAADILGYGLTGVANVGDFFIYSIGFDGLNAADVANVTFDVIVSDGTSPVTSTVSLTVDGVNDAPTVSVTPQALNENDFTVLAGYENAYKLITELEMFNIMGVEDVDLNDNLTLSLVTDSSNFTSTTNAGIVNSNSGVVQLTAADILGYGLTGVANVGDFFIYSLGFDGLNASETSTATFNVILSDGLAPVTSTVTLTVNGVNDAPTVVAAPAITLSETDFATLAGFPNAYKIITETEMYAILGAEDVDVNDSLTLSLVTDSSNFTSTTNAGIVNSNSGVVQLTAADIVGYGLTGVANVGDFFIYSIGFDGLNAADVANVTFDVILSDGTSPVTSTVSLTVDGVNDAPVVTSAVVINVDENQLDNANNSTLTVAVDDEYALHNFVYDLDVTDDHNFNRLGTTLSLTITTSSSGLVHAFSHDNLDYIKGVALEVIAIPEIATALASVTNVTILTLIAQLQAASSVHEIAVILTNVGITPSLTAGVLSLTFPDASILEEKGLLTIDVNSDGSYLVSSSLFNNLGIVDNVTLSFDYIATDSAGSTSDAKTVSVSITGSNDVPTISDVTISTSEDALTNSTKLEIDVDSPYALTNFTYDLDVTDDFNFEMATNTKIGFTLETMDPELLTAFQTNNVAYIKSVALQLIAIPEVTAAITDPSALLLINSLNSATSVAELFTIVNGIPGVSAAMTTTGLSLSVEDASILVTKGLLAINIDGSGSYTLESSLFDSLSVNDKVSISFDYVANDSGGATSEAKTITVNIQGTNDAPTVVATPATTLSETDFATLSGNVNSYKIITETEMYSILGANDVDVNDSLTLSLVTDSSNFTSTTNSGIDNTTSGVVQLTAADITALGITANVGDFFIYSLGFDGLNASETSTATFNVILSDGIAPVTSTVTLTVNGVNDAPIASASATIISNSVSYVGQLVANDTDLNDTLTYTYDNTSVSMSMTVSGLSNLDTLMALNNPTSISALSELKALALNFVDTGSIAGLLTLSPTTIATGKAAVTTLLSFLNTNTGLSDIKDFIVNNQAAIIANTELTATDITLIQGVLTSSNITALNSLFTSYQTLMLNPSVQSTVASILSDNVISTAELAQLSQVPAVQSLVAQMNIVLSANESIIELMNVSTVIARLQEVLSVDTVNGEITATAEIPSATADVMIDLNATTGAYEITNPYLATLPNNTQVEVKFDYTVTDSAGASDDSTAAIMITSENVDKVSASLDDNGILVMGDEKDIDMASLLSNITSNINVADIDSIDLSSNEHILSNLTIADFQEMVSDSSANTLEIKGENNDIIKLDPAIWLKDTSDTDTNSVVDNADDNFISYKATTTDSQVLTLLIDKDIIVQDI